MSGADREHTARSVAAGDSRSSLCLSHTQMPDWGACCAVRCRRSRPHQHEEALKHFVEHHRKAVHVTLHRVLLVPEDLGRLKHTVATGQGRPVNKSRGSRHTAVAVGRS